MIRLLHALSIATTLALSIGVSGSVRAGKGDVAPGAYCPFPEPGQAPSCMEPAQAEYSDFFTALDDGDISDADSERLESEVAAGAAGDAPYLAITSLSYGYYRLAQRAAASPGEDPAVAARLQRWNGLLSAAYDTSANDPSYRLAVKEAASDIQQRAPAVMLACADEAGNSTQCNSTEAVIRGINRTQESVGIRGALERLLGRMFGGGES